MKFRIIASLVLLAVLAALAVLFAPGGKPQGRSHSSSDDSFRIQ